MTSSLATGGTDLGRRISERRERVGVSRAEAAERAGLAAEYLSYLESSQAANPTQATLIHLAAALDTSVGALSGAGSRRPAGSAPRTCGCECGRSPAGLSGLRPERSIDAGLMSGCLPRARGSRVDSG
ncbi:MAG: helix-turn-helix transcriptional regulator [Actinobacteria bacterium]|nr:helix-turn-helix transcriptional regulator [Actinomycetota bacterium]